MSIQSAATVYSYLCTCIAAEGNSTLFGYVLRQAQHKYVKKSGINSVMKWRIYGTCEALRVEERWEWRMKLQRMGTTYALAREFGGFFVSAVENKTLL
jgi:hypothetical protein